jgi:hypothetical protein
MFDAEERSHSAASHCSVSDARMIVGPTVPMATRTDRSKGSWTKQALAIEMTIALRTPTFE